MIIISRTDDDDDSNKILQFFPFRLFHYQLTSRLAAKSASVTLAGHHFTAASVLITHSLINARQVPVQANKHLQVSEW